MAIAKTPCTIGSGPGCAVIECCTTCPAKTLAPPIPMIFSTAPPGFTRFRDCGCRSLEGADSQAKGTSLSKVESA